MTLTIENDGPEIVASNFWDSEMARHGYFFLSVNGGAARLLIPDSRISEVAEMETGKFVILSRGLWMKKANALELLFDDGTEEPYSIHLGPEQLDRLIPPHESRRDLTFSAWSRNAIKLFERPAKFRMVKILPCLESWRG